MRSINFIRILRRLITGSIGHRKSEAGYHYRPGDVVIEDFAKFSGISLDIVAERVANCQLLNAQEWNALDASSFSERAATFYESSHNFVFDTLSANPNPETVINKLNRFNPLILDSIRTHAGKRLFEFGGGIGVFCQIAAGMGKDVYYMELPGIAFEFAKWRFKKLKLNITPIEAKADAIYVPGKYDIVYTDAVLEHLPQALQVEATKALGQSVDKGGLLLFLVDLSGPREDEPMHHHVDIRELHDHLSSSELSCEDGYHKACSIWRKR
jgi:SAM-dependent methyltransferase